MLVFCSLLSTLLMQFSKQLVYICHVQEVFLELLGSRGGKDPTLSSRSRYLSRMRSLHSGNRITNDECPMLLEIQEA